MYSVSKIFHCKVIQLLWAILKAIFAVSYIRHKGIRKIAFILGCLNGLFALFVILRIGNTTNYEYFSLVVVIFCLIEFLWGWYLSLLVFAFLKLLWIVTKWVASSFYNEPVFDKVRSILLVRYIKNIGIRRICIILGGLISLSLLLYVLVQEGISSFLHNTNFIILTICMVALFYVPFILTATLKWISEGFQKSQKKQKNNVR